MSHKSSVKILITAVFCIFAVILAMLALVPFLNGIFAVEVNIEQPSAAADTVAGLPEEIPVTVYYIMEEDSKKISGIYVEVFPTADNTVYYLEIPADTKVTLSEELYKNLQAYAPELPQYLKLSNMAENFSAEYSMTGCNRILSEVLGVSLTGYVRTDSVAFASWKELQTLPKTDASFFDGYAEWIENSTSGHSPEERWSYYESRRKLEEVVTETAPGSRENEGYVISGKRSGEWIRERLLREQ